MKTLFLLFFCFLSVYTIAQPLSTAWIAPIPGSLYEQNNSMAQAPCGDVYTVGFFQGTFGSLTSVGSEDGFIAKYNDQGQLQWIKQLAGTSSDRVNGIVIANDNEIYIVGEFRDKFYYNNDSLVSQNQLDVLIAKLDSSGTIQWASSANGWGYESGNDIALMPNGNLVITGYYENNLDFGGSSLLANGLRDIFIATIDPQGNPQWLKTLSGPAFEEGKSIATDSSNNIYIAGSFRDFLYPNGNTVAGEGSYDVYLAKYDQTGQLLWIKTMGGPAADEGTYVKVDHHQNVVVTGWYDRYIQVDTVLLSGSKEEDGFAAKFAPNGDFLWVIPLAGTFDERTYGVDFDADDNLYIMGTLDSLLILGGDSLNNRHLNRPTDIFIAKYDEAGNYKWAQTLGHYYNDFCYDLLVKDATTIYLAGSFQDTSIFITDTLISQNDYDVFLAKFDIDTTVAIPKIPANVTNDIQQLLLYPNPSHQQSTLYYTLTQTTDVNILIYDLLGSVHQTILLKNQPIGPHQLKLNRPSREAGVYFVQIKTNRSSKVIELLVD
ncbi:T9SS type A sorting domain-containing protein [Aureispira anguillae]|uniref:T9SS type A sorting domain-containing protein n=1 Tax=Aureispira anguillae TaxID=2864201 RepID=A0A915YHT2_9BACT|nr:T9SS type A sorting domain-containing protein [Aureispira anguillae]BDS13328.1 T9SS type A sorting domain-containing protein [Aureispira anguillae]